MTDQRLVAPVRDDGGLGVYAARRERRQCADDVGIGVGANQPAHVLDPDDAIDLADHVVHGQNRTRIDEHGLVALLDQIRVALELVARQQGPHPPDAGCQLDGFGEVGPDVVVHLAVIADRHPPGVEPFATFG